mmetsp:Transcript_32041/g.78013  ORF Transcript_32041/g.78013 Transcript_32041/m.78013 type:complete len:104 (-) Transcript_32041:4807-5118(-)
MHKHKDKLSHLSKQADPHSLHVELVLDFYSKLKQRQEDEEEFCSRIFSCDGRKSSHKAAEGRKAAYQHRYLSCPKKRRWLYHCIAHFYFCASLVVPTVEKTEK